MKKMFIILSIILLCTACSIGNKVEKEKTIEKEEKKEETVEEVKYKDLNTTPIAFYSLDGNTLTKLTTINRNVSSLDDIGLFQIYPSNDEKINLNDYFGNSFHNKWMEYNTNNNIKIGFNIKFNTNEEAISYNILDPSTTFFKWQYLMNYLYDDYANLGKGFYSHLESSDCNDNTLYTAFKMQAGEIDKIISKIELTVFTYDSEDDFLDNEYRGNSKYTINICLNNIC